MIKFFKTAALPLVLGLGPFVLYAPTVSFDFTIDDPLVTYLNRDLKNFRGNYLAFFRTNLYSGTEQARTNNNLYRPLLMSSLALNYQLSGYRFNPAQFHFTNIFLYSLSVILVFYLIGAMYTPEVRPGFAFAIALLFMVFPSHLESICNIKHREEILAFVFGIGAWWMVLQSSYAVSRKVAIQGFVAPLFFLFALLSKESAILLFPAMIAWEYIHGKHQFEKITNLPLYFFTFSLALAVYLILRRHALGFWLTSPGTATFFLTDENLVTRLLTSSKIFMKYYLWDQLIALKLNPSFSTRFLISVERLVTLRGLAASAFLSGVLLLSARQFFKLRSVYAFWILFFFITSFLTTNSIPTGTAGAFRLMFTPSLGLCVMIATTLSELALRVESHPKVPIQTSRAIFAGMVFFAALFYGAATYNRIPAWKNDGTIFSYSSKIEPGNPTGHYAAGQYYDRIRQPGEKYSHYQKALDIFMARRGESTLLTERAMDAFSVVATEIAFRQVDKAPDKAIELSVLAIELFERLQKLRSGRMDSNIAAPYYVKALALNSLGHRQESIETCRTALAITYHRGLERLLLTLLNAP